jgi:4a-hydroxytetrahydrobiopterin dehydratase
MAMSMASSSTHLTLSLPLPTLPKTQQHSHFHLPVAVRDRLRRRQTWTRICALGTDLLGDFGARDPFPEELESNFGEKVLGSVDTEHKILIPVASALSLAEQDCSPVSAFQSPMSFDDAKKLLKKIVGWRLLDEEGGLKLQCLWKVRDFACGVELINRILKVVEPTGHFPTLHLEQPNQVRAELWTSSIGGLSMNDFIVAAKMDNIKTSDLAPKKRVWA